MPRLTKEEINAIKAELNEYDNKKNGSKEILSFTDEEIEHIKRKVISHAKKKEDDLEFEDIKKSLQEVTKLESSEVDQVIKDFVENKKQKKFTISESLSRTINNIAGSFFLLVITLLLAYSFVIPMYQQMAPSVLKIYNKIVERGSSSEETN